MKVQAALERLIKFEWPEQKRPQSSIEDLVNLVARFARALGAEGVEELTRRAKSFANLTAPGSPLNDARGAAYRRACKATEPYRPGPAKMSKPRRKLKINGSTPSTSGWERIAGDWPRVEKLLGHADCMTWHLSQALAFSRELAAVDPTSEELGRWQDELFKFSIAVNEEHLFGCHLIARYRDALSAKAGGNKPYQELLAELGQHPAAAKKLVQDAARHLREVIQDASEHKAQEASKPTLTFSLGDTSITLITEGIEPIVFDNDDEMKVLRFFAEKVIAGAPSERVSFTSLNGVIEADNAEMDKASPKLRQVISRINKRINRAAGKTLGKKKYILVEKGEGYRLNPTFRWAVDQKYRNSLGSVFIHDADPTVIEQTQSTSGGRTQPRSRRRTRRSDDD
jgi:hypothetical protein